MKAYRKQGATPKLGESSGVFLLKGELAPELVKPGSNSPLSQRSNGTLGNVGYLGTVQDVSQLFLQLKL